MKSIKLIFVFLFIAGALVAQQFPRDKVVVEIGTGTW
jgi:hypothetical protein